MRPTPNCTHPASLCLARVRRLALMACQLTIQPRDSRDVLAFFFVLIFYGTHDMEKVAIQGPLTLTNRPPHDPIQITLADSHAERLGAMKESIEKKMHTLVDGTEFSFGLTKRSPLRFLPAPADEVARRTTRMVSFSWPTLPPLLLQGIVLFTAMPECALTFRHDPAANDGPPRWQLLLTVPDSPTLRPKVDEELALWGPTWKWQQRCDSFRALDAMKAEQAPEAQGVVPLRPPGPKLPPPPPDGAELYDLRTATWYDAEGKELGQGAMNGRKLALLSGACYFRRSTAQYLDAKKNPIGPAPLPGGPLGRAPTPAKPN